MYLSRATATVVYSDPCWAAEERELAIDVNKGGDKNRYLSVSKYQNSVVHLDVEDFSEELLRQHSYAIKNQLVASKAPY